MLTAFGGAGGLLLLLAGSLCAPRVLPPLMTVCRPHFHWMLWCAIAFMLLSEWPKGSTTGRYGTARWVAGWRTPAAGLLTFLLSGLLGFILFSRPVIPLAASFQSLMPAFAGLFALPWLLLNLVSRAAIPPQRTDAALDLDLRSLLQGAAAGGLGGGLAAFVPVLTGGIGGLLAGHATSTRDERVFLVAQGAARTVYYVGGLLLLFVPGLQAARGGAAGMLKAVHLPTARGEYTLALAAAGIAGAAALAVLPLLSRSLVRLLDRVPYQTVSAAALVFVVALVAGLTGLPGLLVMLTATGIGLLPVLADSRRINCLGVILLPLACAMSGGSATVARWLGLL
jgi:putative membrane protein